MSLNLKLKILRFCIGNYESCLKDTNTNAGSHLLKLTIKMLQKYKDKYKIKKIILNKQI